MNAARYSTICWLRFSSVAWVLTGITCAIGGAGCGETESDVGASDDAGSTSDGGDCFDVMCLTLDAGHGSDPAGQRDAQAPTTDDAGAGVVGEPLPAPWVRGPSFPHPVDHHATVVLETGGGAFLYVLGGLVSDPAGQPSAVYDSVHRSCIDEDGALGAWEEMEPLLLPLAFHAAAVAPDGSVVVAGGVTANMDGSLAAVPYVMASVPDADGNLSEWVGREPFATPLLHGTAVTVGERIYLAGGGAGRSEFTTRVVSWAMVDEPERDIAETRTEADLPSPRSHHSSAVVNGQWVVLGGMVEGDSSAADVLRAVMEGDAVVGWEVVGSLGEGPMTASAVVDGDRLFLVGGGKSQGPTDEIIEVTMSAGGLTVQPATVRLPFARAHVHQTPLFRGYLYSVGGRTVGADRSQSSSSDVYYAPWPD